jgi:hypothetical protein
MKGSYLAGSFLAFSKNGVRLMLPAGLHLAKGRKS